MHQFFYYCVTLEEYLRNALIHCDFEKAELYGAEYIFDLATTYARQSVYETYVTDAMRLICSLKASERRIEIDMPRYYDILHPAKKEPEKSADELAEDVLRRAGITITGGDEDECV